MIEPFANNHQSMQIGELIIENQADKIIIYGDIDLQFDASGHEQALQLHELTGKILKVFENKPKGADDSASSQDNTKQIQTEVDNPFL